MTSSLGIAQSTDLATAPLPTMDQYKKKFSRYLLPMITILYLTGIRLFLKVFDFFFAQVTALTRYSFTDSFHDIQRDGSATVNLQEVYLYQRE